MKSLTIITLFLLLTESSFAQSAKLDSLYFDGIAFFFQRNEGCDKTPLVLLWDKSVESDSISIEVLIENGAFIYLDPLEFSLLSLKKTPYDNIIEIDEAFLTRLFQKRKKYNSNLYYKRIKGLFYTSLTTVSNYNHDWSHNECQIHIDYDRKNKLRIITQVK